MIKLYADYEGNGISFTDVEAMRANLAVVKQCSFLLTCVLSQMDMILFISMRVPVGSETITSLKTGISSEALRQMERFGIAF